MHDSAARSPRGRRTTAALITVTAAGIAAGVLARIVAARRPTGADVGSTGSDPTAPDQAAGARHRWTAERMRNARPAPMRKEND